LFDGTDEELWKLIDKLGEMPIPKYLGRPVEKMDRERFQTIFASKIGAVSPPTAGLHFTKELMMRLEIKGAHFAEMTLHNGLGSFRAVEVEDLTKHKMDSEYYEIPSETAKIVNRALDNKKRIVAVGSSVVRGLESSVSSVGRLNAGSGWTDKFIFPHHDFSIPNAFVTNFHTPESTLMMLTAAFAEYDFLVEAYQEALKKKYRFLAYGDALLII
jgi:S-adenosylmethionine:tRNA ribosyltransferase-isomerase